MIIQHMQEISSNYVQSQFGLDVHEIFTKGVNIYLHSWNIIIFFSNWLLKSKVMLPPKNLFSNLRASSTMYKTPPILLSLLKFGKCATYVRQDVNIRE